MFNHSETFDSLFLVFYLCISLLDSCNKVLQLGAPHNRNVLSYSSGGQKFRILAELVPSESRERKVCSGDSHGLIDGCFLSVSSHHLTSVRVSESKFPLSIKTPAILD